MHVYICAVVKDSMRGMVLHPNHGKPNEESLNPIKPFSTMDNLFKFFEHFESSQVSVDPFPSTSSHSHIPSFHMQIEDSGIDCNLEISYM